MYIDNVILFISIKKDRFLNKKKSIYLINAKKIVLNKNFFKTLY